MEDLGLPGDASSTTANSANGDGSVIVGSFNSLTGQGTRASRWIAGSGWQVLALPTGALNSDAYAISADGSTIGGRSNFAGAGFQAVLWAGDPPTGVEGSPFGGASSAIRCMSVDGSVGVGSFTFSGGAIHAARWSSGGSVLDLGALTGGHLSLAEGTNVDGSVVVGGSNLANGRFAAFRWSAAAGMTQLAGLPGTYASYAWGISPEGLVVGGDAFDFATYVAVLWSPLLGVVDLNKFLPKLGVDLSNWKLERCAALGEEGRVLTGYGTHLGEVRGWIVTGLPSLAVGCSGDLDADWRVNDSDFVIFLRQYSVLDCAEAGMTDACSGDLDRDGVVDDADFVIFAVAYDALLCP